MFDYGTHLAAGSDALLERVVVIATAVLVMGILQPWERIQASGSLKLSLLSSPEDVHCSARVLDC